MSKRDVETTLRDILESIERVQRYVTDVNQSDFAENTEKQDAVIRNIEIIGEAVKGIPDAVKGAHEDIDWKKIASMRDRLIHDYYGVNLDIVWDVARNRLPELKPQILRLLGE